jgi:hypothetical protein
MIRKDNLLHFKRSSHIFHNSQTVDQIKFSWNECVKKRLIELFAYMKAYSENLSVTVNQSGERIDIKD